MDSYENLCPSAKEFFTFYTSYFNFQEVPVLKRKLGKLSPDEQDNCVRLFLGKLHSPKNLLLISIFLGGLGINRFMLGDTKMGVLKICCSFSPIFFTALAPLMFSVFNILSALYMIFSLLPILAFIGGVASIVFWIIDIVHAKSQTYKFNFKQVDNIISSAANNS